MKNGTNKISSGFWPGLTQFLAGRKTYLVTAAAVIYLIGADAGWWPRNPLVLQLLGLGGLAALRAGIGKTKPASPGAGPPEPQLRKPVNPPRSR